MLMTTTLELTDESGEIGESEIKARVFSWMRGGNEFNDDINNLDHNESTSAELDRCHECLY